MSFNPEKYRHMLSPETRLMCDMLSPAFDPAAFDIERLLHGIDPRKLTDTLRNHRLYPHFYKVWNATGTQLPVPAWHQFGTTLKQMVERNRIQMMLKTATLVNIVKAFEGEGIPVIALKGPALAQRIYGDVGMRYSWDIDLLILPQHLEQARQILFSLDYTNIYGSGRLTPKQVKYCINNYKHFSFINPSLNQIVEIHWQLPQLAHFVNIPITDYFTQSGKISIGDNQVMILNPETEYLYLSAHAAFHSFYRLAWLIDIITIKNAYPQNESQLKNTSLSKLNNAVLQLSEIFFKTPSHQNFKPKLLFIGHCFKTIQKIEGKTRKPSIIREYLGRILITSNLQLKIALIKPLLTTPSDWATVPLPDPLFFLYFPLRPLLYLWRKIVCIKGSSF